MLLLFLWSSTAFSATLTVGTGKTYDPASYGGDLSLAIEAACAAAGDGDTVQIKDGQSGASIGTVDINDTMTAETYIEPETAGGVTWSGTTDFAITGNYWHFRNFIIDGATGATYDQVIRITADNVKITNNIFRDSGTSGQNFHAIEYHETSDDLEVANNLFDNWSGIQVLNDEDAGDVALNTHIHHNHFLDTPSTAADDSNPVFLNGVHASSDDQEQGAIVEYNVFENCNGDGEGLEVKNSGNTIRYNVF